MSVMGEATPSSAARFTRNRWPSEDTAYCCLRAPGSGPPAMRTGNRVSGIPVSSDSPFRRQFHWGHHHLAVQRHVKDFFAVLVPACLCAAVTGDLELAARSWKRLDVDLEPARFVRLVC